MKPDHVFIHNTHTHSAPRVGGVWIEKGAPNHEYMKYTFNAIVRNAVETINDEAAFKPFKIEYAVGRSNIGMNRRETELPVDENVYAIRFMASDNKPIVSLMNYACHPVSLGAGSNVVSSEYPGTATALLEEKWGGKVFYFTGASGNIDPRIGIKTDPKVSENNGKQLAESFNEVTFTPVRDNKSFAVFSETVRLPFQIGKITKEAVEQHAREIKDWDMFPTWKEDVENWCEEICGRVDKGDVQDYLSLQINAVRIGGVVLFFSQGEPFNEYQTALREKFPGIPILVAGYTNGQNSYIPSGNAYGNSAYDYETKQMHVYIKAPYPLSSNAPSIYESAIENSVKQVLK